MVKLVILPGWDNDESSWQSMLDKLSVHSPYVLPLPGFGQPPLLNETWGVPEYARYASKIIDGLHQGNIVLLGHSFGGRLAAEIASTNPSWLRGLVLYGAPCVYRPSAKAKILIALAKVAKRLGITRRSLLPNKELQMAEEKGLGTVYRKTIGYDQETQLKKISVRTLLLWGKDDTEAPLRLGKEMHTVIKGSKIEIIEHAGHHLHLTHPHIFYGKVQQFIQSL